MRSKLHECHGRTFLVATWAVLILAALAMTGYHVWTGAVAGNDTVRGRGNRNLGATRSKPPVPVSAGGEVPAQPTLPEVAAEEPSPPAASPEWDMRKLENQKWDYVAEEIYDRPRADRIDRFLEGSPMAGLGEQIVDEANRTGVNPYLCPAIAYVESSLGFQPYQSPCNAWGMMGRRYYTWVEGVRAFFDNIVAHWGAAQSAYELRGYCVPDYPWMPNTQGLVEAIGR